jgi:predicted regulator of amino acid metabolism with ACT domain
MWGKIEKKLSSYPERLRVARVLIENGFSVKNGKIFCNNIAISKAEVARVAGVDRRTVTQTIQTIEQDETLRPLFQHLRNAGHSLKDLVKFLGFGAEAASQLAKRGISIRQAIVDDPELSPEPRLTLIAESKIPGELVQDVLKIRGVDKVLIY